MYRGPIHQIHQDTSRNAIHQKRYIYRGALLLEMMPSCCLTTCKSCWQANDLALARGLWGSPLSLCTNHLLHINTDLLLLGKTAVNTHLCGLPCFRHCTVWPLSALHPHLHHQLHPMPHSHPNAIAYGPHIFLPLLQLCSCTVRIIDAVEHCNPKPSCHSVS